MNDRHTNKQNDIPTDQQTTDWQTDRCKDRKPDRQMEKWTDGQADRVFEQVDILTYIAADKQKDKQTSGLTDI